MISVTSPTERKGNENHYHNLMTEDEDSPGI